MYNIENECAVPMGFGPTDILSVMFLVRALTILKPVTCWLEAEDYEQRWSALGSDSNSK